MAVQIAGKYLDSPILGYQLRVAKSMEVESNGGDSKGVQQLSLLSSPGALGRGTVGRVSQCRERVEREEVAGALRISFECIVCNVCCQVLNF